MPEPKEESRMKNLVCKRILYVIGGLLLLFLITGGVIWKFYPLLLPSLEVKQSEAATELFAMDTYISMTAYGTDAEGALTEASNEIRKIEQLLSVTNPDSDIHAVNHSGGQPVMVSRETAEIVSFALQMAEETNGALEPTVYPVLTAWGFTTDENRVPADGEVRSLLESVGYDRVYSEGNSICLEDGMMLDLGAVGKGYAGDMAVQVLRNHGITSALLDIGGNIQAIGSKEDGSDWRLGLRDPFSDGTLGVLEISDRAVITSGNYERYFIGEDGRRYGHIIDPATGYPVENDLASVTVIAEEGRLCDALSTALFVIGVDRAVDYWRHHQDFDMILVTEAAEIYLTEGVADVFRLDSYHRSWKVQVIRDE